MSVKLLIGIVLFVIGLLAAGVGIVGVGMSDPVDVAPTIVQENRSLNLAGISWLALPWIAGLCLAVGGVLIGLSLGNFKHPRTHIEPGDVVVDPEGYHKMKHV
jgi:hypothetical protein